MKRSPEEELARGFARGLAQRRKSFDIRQPPKKTKEFTEEFTDAYFDLDSLVDALVDEERESSGGGGAAHMSPDFNRWTAEEVGKIKQDLQYKTKAILNPSPLLALKAIMVFKQYSVFKKVILTLKNWQYLTDPDRNLMTHLLGIQETYQLSDVSFEHQAHDITATVPSLSTGQMQNVQIDAAKIMCTSTDGNKFLFYLYAMIRPGIASPFNTSVQRDLGIGHDFLADRPLLF